jgi:ABC-type multidrug transport system permease subunit
VRQVATPFFFQPQHFLIANVLILLVFGGLTAAAVAMRRRTDWHRRLHLCAMAALMGPGFGRLLPMPLLIPYAYQAAAVAGLAFPAAGMIVDWRRGGKVHPAWWWGMGVLAATLVATEAVVFSPLGDAIYAAVAAGSPGAGIDPLAFGSPPPVP